jgi:hypothetical protein
MAKRTVAELKGWLETGDTPTQAQFSDLIDTVHPESPVYSLIAECASQAEEDAAWLAGAKMVVRTDLLE